MMMSEGWVHLDENKVGSWCYVRAGRTLCGIATARTDFDQNENGEDPNAGKRMLRDCIACWAVLKKDKDDGK